MLISAPKILIIVDIKVWNFFRKIKETPFLSPKTTLKLKNSMAL